MPTENNKRIARNTAFLYFRMILIMLVSLYTSRIVLNTLGIVDYGIYNVVGGFVIMLGFLNNAMVNSTQRFLSFEIGNKNSQKLSEVFSMSINIHFIIGLLIIIISESIGLWFVKTQLTIPFNRLDAALWVFQFSMFSFFLNVITVPFNSLIIAYERMNIFAIISIIDVTLRLFIVFTLSWFHFDRLIMYSFLIFCVSLILLFTYAYYCNIKFKDVKYFRLWNTKLFKTLLSFAGWNLWGNAAAALYGQGVNMLLNIFFGPILNAAAGIANQLKSGINGFVSNFQVAMNPQIIKSYASDDIEYMHTLIYSGAKYSFYLLWLLSLPILLETDIVLKIWLNTVPEYSVIFTRLIIVMALINSLSGPLMTSAQATGRIKLYQGVVGGVLLLILPFTYFSFKFGFPPQSTYIVSILIYSVAFLIRLHIVSRLINLSFKKFFIDVILKATIITFMSLILPIIIRLCMHESVIRLLSTLIVSFVSVVITIFILGLNASEQKFVRNKIENYIGLLKIRN